MFCLFSESENKWKIMIGNKSKIIECEKILEPPKEKFFKMSDVWFGDYIIGRKCKSLMCHYNFPANDMIRRLARLP